MGASINRIDASDMTKDSEQIKKIKDQLYQLSINDHKANRQYIDNIDNTLTKLGKEYNSTIREYNSLLRSLELIEEFENNMDVIDPKYSPKIKEISDNLKKFISQIKRTDIDLSKSKDYKIYSRKIVKLGDKLEKLKTIFDTIENETKQFDNFKKQLLGKISRSVKSIQNIESMGYEYNNPEVSDKDVERMEDIFNDIKSIYKEDIIKAYNIFNIYKDAKTKIIRRGNSIISYEDHLNKTRDYVNSYTMDKIDKYLKWINYRKFAKWKNDETIKLIEAGMKTLSNLLKNPVDFLFVKTKIDEVEKLAKDEYNRVKGKKEDEEEEERAAERRRRNSYSSSSYSSSSYSSSSYSSSGSSSFGGFGGGSFGGGGASGSW